MKIVPLVFFLGAVASLVLSVALWIIHWREYALFTGLWVPSLLGFGSYLDKRSDK